VGMRDDNILYLEHGKPMVFGKNRDRGIRLRGLTPEVVSLGNGVVEDDLLVHDAHVADPTLAWMLSRMEPPHFPVPMGVFRDIRKPTYGELLFKQHEEARARRGPGDLRKLFQSADTWEVKDERAMGANAAEALARVSSNGGSHA
jgi:2-oxoglutarate/2-oxoacid ferredoxin oxidoreductase subunit beta